MILGDFQVDLSLLSPLLYTQELDELQSLELFESFLGGSYRGSLSELNQRLSSEREQATILQQIRDYYYSERLHLLRCLKQLLGFWQDPGHDYRVRGSQLLLRSTFSQLLWISANLPLKCQSSKIIKMLVDGLG